MRLGVLFHHLEGKVGRRHIWCVKLTIIKDAQSQSLFCGLEARSRTTQSLLDILGRVLRIFRHGGKGK